jgi:hypothetical protein
MASKSLFSALRETQDGGVFITPGCMSLDEIEGQINAM